MLIRIPIFCLLACVITTPGSAQTSYAQASTSSRNLPVTVTRVMSALDLFNGGGLEAGKIEGSPYQDKAFVKGMIETSAGKFEAPGIRYNIVFDQIEIRLGDSIYVVPPDVTVKKVEIGYTRLVVEQGIFDKVSQPSYFSPVEAGKLSLYSKMMIKYTEPREPGPIETDGRPGRYDRGTDVYFCKIGNKSLVQVRQAKALLDIIPDHQDEMEQFVRKAPKAATKKDELLRFIRHYNQLSGGTQTK